MIKMDKTNKKSVEVPAEDEIDISQIAPSKRIWGSDLMIIDDFGGRSMQTIEPVKFDTEGAPKIKKLSPLTLSELAEREGFTVFEFEKNIKERFRKIEQKLLDQKPFLNTGDDWEETIPLIDVIYNLYSLRKEKGKDIPQFLEHLDSFDAFFDYFCDGCSWDLKTYLQGWIGHFVKQKVNPQRVLELHPFWSNQREAIERKELNIYEAGGEWCLLPEKRKGVYEFVEVSVIDEIIKLLESGERIDPGYIHGSNSVVLEGIEKYGALLSAAELTKRGEKIKGGAYSREVPDPDKFCGWGAIYVHDGNKSKGSYVMPEWFDEFEVSFGIDRNKQYEYLRNRPGGMKDVGPDVEGTGGYKIGSEVPLSHVTHIFCSKVHKSEVEVWAQKNVPQTKVISLEAANVLSEYQMKIYHFGLQRGIRDFKEVWEQLKTRAFKV